METLKDWLPSKLSRFVFVILAILAGLTALGTVFGVINDARAFVTPVITYVGSLVIVLIYVVLELVIRHRIRSEKEEKRKQARILLIEIRLAVVGAVLLLWIPRIVGTAPQSNLLVAFEHELNTFHFPKNGHFSECN